MLDQNIQEYAGSIDARSNKDRAGRLGTRATSEKLDTKYQNQQHKRKQGITTIGIGTWNVRTLWYAGDPHLMIK